MAPAPGRFVWHDLMTTDVEATLEFLVGLFDLEIAAHDVAEEIQYLMLTLKGSNEALFGCVPIEAEEGQRSHWIGYLTVADFKAALADVTGAGGVVYVQPGDDDDDDDDAAGLMAGAAAIVTDPLGAVLSPYKSAEDIAELDDLVPVGRIGWHELMTSDPAAATRFYGELVGWKGGDAVDRGEEGAVIPLARGGSVFGLARQSLPGSPFPPHWSVYFRVADLDATIARARELGGFIFEDPAALDSGRRAMLLDPSGAPIGVWQPG